METRAFLPMRDAPMKILITGGASCPDGLLQQIIAKVNSYFDSEQIRSLNEVITGVEAMA
jgi:4-hydroxy-3-methylbut-2-enyl diphosphate reductase